MKILVNSINLLLICLQIVSCNSDESEPNQATQVDLTEAFLNDFKLSETDYVNINIINPITSTDSGNTSGEIEITIPATYDNLNLSLFSVNFDESKFEISPAIGEQVSFESNSVTYKITSLVDSEKSIQYNVSVMKEEIPEPVITGFAFEKNKNPNLSEDIEALKIVDYPGSTTGGSIITLVPNGTDITSLIPTVIYTGGQLGYRQGDDPTFNLFPTDRNLEVDFTSNYNPLAFSDRNQFHLSVRSELDNSLIIRYLVIVEYENPIEFQQNTITSPTISLGEERRFRLDWTNSGNHPIQGNLEASSYIDNTANNLGNIYAAYLDISDPLQGAYIQPGEKGFVYIDADANGKIIGDYDIDIVFTPKYDVNRAVINDIEDDLNPIEDIFKDVILNVKTTIE